MSEEMNCASCGFANRIVYRFCRRCGTLLEEFTDEPEQKLELNLHLPQKSKSPFTLIELLIVIAIIGILAAIAIPNRPRGSRVHSRQKACNANIRVITGAIEMYNMDANEMMHIVDSEALDRLVKGKYLKSPIIGSEKNCAYSSIGDISQDGQVSCSVHGTIDSPKSLD